MTAEDFWPDYRSASWSVIRNDGSVEPAEVEIGGLEESGYVVVRFKDTTPIRAGETLVCQWVKP